MFEETLNVFILFYLYSTYTCNDVQLVFFKGFVSTFTGVYFCGKFLYISSADMITIINTT